MKNRLIRLFIIIAFLLAYTSLKATQLLPSAGLLAPVFTLLLFIVMIGWLFIYRSNPGLLDNIWFKIFAWIGSLVMGLWGTFMLFSVPVDLGFLAHYIYISISHRTHDSETTALLVRNIDLILLAISASMIGFGFIEVLRGPRTKEVSIAIANLPIALKNLNIIQISDLHIGPTIGKDYVEKVVKQTNALNPDLIFITGDLVDANAELIEQHLQLLGNLKARFGIYFVTGNHEYYWDAINLINKIKTLGFVVLINENRVINVDGINILIAGITDPVGAYFSDEHRPNIIQAAQSTAITQLKILLAHRPDTCIEAKGYGFNLQVSGHTHAGQFFPFNLLVSFSHKYYRRLNKHGETWVYVNPGTGYWGPANRFGVPSEITVFKLTD